LLQGLAAVTETNRQPIEQFGVSRTRTVPTEVVGSIDQPAPEVVVPDPIHDGPPGQGVARIGNPLGQCCPPKSPLTRSGQAKVGTQGLHASERAWSEQLAAPFHIAPAEQVNRAWGMR